MRPFFYFLARPFEFLGNELFVWKDGLILSGKHFVGEIVEGVVSLCRSLFSAQYESDWRVLTGLHPVFARVVQVEVHLPRVRVTEFSDLQIPDQKGAQTTVKEDEVDTKPGVVDAKPALAAEESKIIAQLQKKVGEAVDERLFEI